MSSNSLLDQVQPSNNGCDSTPPPASEFDPAALRLSQDFAATLGVKKLRTTVPVRKPGRTWFVRVHPDPAYRLPTMVLELKEERETYLVATELRQELSTESAVSPRLLVIAINRQNVLFFWPIRLPGSDGKIDEWSRSALDAVHEAESRWVRVQADMSLGAYEISVASAAIHDPDWEKLVEEPLKKLLEVAFRDKFIRDLEHPVLKRLRGDA
jgi:hypothetical protein